MQIMKGTWQKYAFWTIVANGGLKAISNPQGIKLAFSSPNELLASIFGLIMFGLFFGSLFYGFGKLLVGISLIFKKKTQ